jgi:RNA polymerase sigma-70 factor (sigma-E family)
VRPDAALPVAGDLNRRLIARSEEIARHAEPITVPWCLDDVPVTFEDYVAARFPALRRLAYLLTGDWSEAEDLVQDALVRCERRWRGIASDDPHAYVRRAVVNGASNWRRRRRLELPLSDDAAVPDHAPGVDARVVLLAALRRLPVDQRQVLVLRYFEQLSEAQTAQALGIPPGTVKSRTARALEALRRAGVDTTSAQAGVPS